MANIHQPLLTISIMALADINRLTFVGFDGGIATAGEKALGVCEADTAKDEACPVNTHGVLMVTAGGAIPLGSEVGVGADGKAVVGTGEGYAMDEATADGDVIRILRGA